jgi:hypothetical protein
MSLKCPFAAPITKGTASCRHAREVVRRGGSEYDCAAEAAHRLCTELFARLKARGLAAFGAEDDLSSMPHSVLVKIQSGGLLGLARIAARPAEDGRVEDVASLVAAACDQHGGVAHVPVEQLDADMTGFKVGRRASRR